MLQRASGARFLWMGLFELLLLATENTPLLSFSLLVQTFPSSRLELLPKLLRSSQNYSSPNKHFLPSSSSSTSTPLLLLKRLPLREVLFSSLLPSPFLLQLQNPRLAPMYVLPTLSPLLLITCTPS